MVDDTEVEGGAPKDEGQIFSDRNRITMKNIQTIQLQKECANCRDYYGLMKKFQGLAVDDQWGKLKCLRTLFPKYRLGHIQEEEDYNRESAVSPFLGIGIRSKKSSSSVPRKCIEDDLCPTPSSSPAKSDTAKARGILLQIEKLYEYLLIIKENSIRLSILRYNSPIDLDLKRNALQMVMQAIEDVETLLDLLTVSKGKMLICRLTEVLPDAVTMKLLSFLLRTFPKYWVNMEKEQLTTAYYYLKSCVLLAEEKDFTAILESLQDSVIPYMVSNLLGVSFLMVILQRGDMLYEKEKEGNFRELWINKCVVIFTIMSAQIPNLSTPIEIFEGYCTSLIEADDHYLGKKLQALFVRIVKNMLDKPDAEYLVVKDEVDKAE